MQGGEHRAAGGVRQREAVEVEMAVHDIERVDLVQDGAEDGRAVDREVVAGRIVVPEGHVDDGDEPGRGVRVGGGEQGHVVTSSH